MLIRLEIIRELNPHFPSNSDEFKSSTGAISTWNLLGTNDVLTYNSLESLPVLGCIGSNGDRTGSQEWILYGQSTIKNDEDYVIADKLLRGHESDAVLLITLTISSVLYDQFSLDEIKTEIESIIRKIKKLCSDLGIQPCSVLRNLGGTDFVVAIPIKPDLDQNLRKSFVLLQGLRNQYIETDEYHYHLYSQVSGIFCFKKRESIESLPVDPNLRIYSQNRVVSGHQFDFSEQLNESLKNGNYKIYTSLGRFSMIADSESMPNILKTRLLGMSPDEKLAACKKGFDGSRTEFAYQLKADELNHGSSKKKHAAISKNDHVTQFEKLLNVAIDLTERQLGTVAGRELKKALKMLRNSLNRNERIGALRDIFSFVSQLCHCLQDEDAWKGYSLNQQTFLGQTNQYYDYPRMNAITKNLAGHLWRAIRNRIESRVEKLDPSFPGTLDYGTAKLINGYSVAAWVSSGVVAFNRKNVSCKTDSFAACVASGTSGRVETQEAFADVRRSIEEDCLFADCSNLKPLKDRSRSWHSRLLLVDISGSIIYRPEVAFLQCFHEMAEFNGWVSNRECVNLRTILNRYQFQVMKSIFDKNPSTSPRNEQASRDQNKLLQSVFNEYRNQRGNISGENIYESINPVYFRDCIMSCFKRRFTNDNFDGQYLASLSDYLNGFNRNPSEKILDGNDPPYEMKHDRYIVFLNQLKGFVRESSSDFAMLVAKCYLARRYVEADEFGSTLVKGVNYNFSCILENVCTWGPMDPHLRDRIKDIFVRWALQLHIVFSIEPNPRSSEKNVVRGMIYHYSRIILVDFIGDYLKLAEIGKLVDDAMKFGYKFSIFGQHLSLATMLSNMTKPDEIQTMVSGDFLSNDPQDRILREFFSLWVSSANHADGIVRRSLKVAEDDSESLKAHRREELSSTAELERLRLEFIYLLWAKSQKMCFENVFSVS
jgi:hypothetical protein